jgi:hypothetical protein
MSYHQFIHDKTQLGGSHGFNPVFMPDYLFDFQKSLVEWSVNKGRAAIFADCGLGKTPMQLVWAENVVRKTNGNVLILAPLAVSQQIVHEAEKFEIEAHRSRDGQPKGKITVTNYDQLHKFNTSDFVGVVCDESSILKSMKGKVKTEITVFMRKLPYRLLATATPSPNDFIELGTSSEALGYMGAMDMMNKFFKNDQNNSKVGRHRGHVVKWRLKGHAELPFWRWVTSWSRAIRKPSDIGFDDSDFILPELIEREHIVESKQLAEGMLFAMPATNLKEQRDERRRSMTERCEMVADLVNHDQPALVWCHLNDEGDLLEKLIPGCVQVSGRDDDEKQEKKLIDFATGKVRVLVTKPQIGAWGLNFQHCNHMTFFPSHSFEQYYQGVRRCWRFGQKRKVTVDIVTTEGEGRVMRNLERKSDQAVEMFERLVKEMNNSLYIGKGSIFDKKEAIPSWL